AVRKARERIDKVNKTAAARGVATTAEKNLDKLASGRKGVTDRYGNPTVDEYGKPVTQVNPDSTTEDMARYRDERDSLKKQRVNTSFGNYLDRSEMPLEERTRLNASKYGPEVTPDEIRASEALLNADMQAEADKQLPGAQLNANLRQAARLREESTQRIARKKRWDALSKEKQDEYRNKIKAKVKARRDQQALKIREYLQNLYDRSHGRQGRNYRPEPQEPQTPEQAKMQLANRRQDFVEWTYKTNRQDRLAATEAKAVKERMANIRDGRAVASAEAVENIRKNVARLQKAALGSDAGNAIPHLAGQVYKLFTAVANPAGRTQLNRDYNDARRTDSLAQFITQASVEKYVFAADAEEPEGRSSTHSEYTPTQVRKGLAKAFNGDGRMDKIFEDVNVKWGFDNPPTDDELSERLQKRYTRFRGVYEGVDQKAFDRAWMYNLRLYDKGGRLEKVWGNIAPQVDAQSDAQQAHQDETQQTGAEATVLISSILRKAKKSGTVTAEQEKSLRKLYGLIHQGRMKDAAALAKATDVTEWSPNVLQALPEINQSGTLMAHHQQRAWNEEPEQTAMKLTASLEYLDRRAEYVMRNHSAGRGYAKKVIKTIKGMVSDIGSQADADGIGAQYVRLRKSRAPYARAVPETFWKEFDSYMEMYGIPLIGSGEEPPPDPFALFDKTENRLRSRRGN
ncbi:MAG: hypothetical protein U9Q07_07620, partial [Planctomycetota bacterium]|nr:hypothetical protein [Planctomycetota bacterium]